jgi:hypothetical protein
MTVTARMGIRCHAKGVFNYRQLVRRKPGNMGIFDEGHDLILAPE